MSSPTKRWTLLLGVVPLLASASCSTDGGGRTPGAAEPVELLNVSYDPTR